MTRTVLVEPMTKSHVSLANFNKNREVIFQFEPNNKDQYKFSYEKSSIVDYSKLDLWTLDLVLLQFLMS